METVPYVSIKECSVKERQIVVISVRAPEKPLIEFDKHYCHYKPPKEIKYKINYLQLTNENYISNLDPFVSENRLIFNEPCNELLIYFDFDLRLDVVIKRLLLLFRDFEIKKTVYIANNDNEEEMRRCCDINDYNSYKFVFFKQNEPRDITVQGEHMLPTTYTQLKNTNQKLTCQAWFKKFLSRVFSCGVKRLIQIAGTCYLNVVVNCIILSAPIRSLFIEKMNEFVQEFPESKKYITRPLLNGKEMTSCRRFAANKFAQEIQYLYRLIYNTVCKSERPFPRVPMYRREDVMLETSTEFFSATTSGEGGSPISTILFFLLGSGLEFVVALETEDRNMFYVANDVIQTVNFTLYDYKNFFYELYFGYFKLYKLEDAPTQPIVLYIPKDDWILEDNVQRITDLGYTSQSSCIHLSYRHYKFESTKIDEHVVNGFLCDGVRKVYDSAENIIFENDWLESKAEFAQAYSEALSEINPDEIITNFDCVYVLFSKTDVTENACFETTEELTGSWAEDAEPRDLTWNVPKHRLIRHGKLTEYFNLLLSSRVPGIDPNIFIPKSTSYDDIANAINSDFTAISDILRFYPQIRFTKYPSGALILLSDDIRLSEDEIIEVPINIDSSETLNDIYEKLISLKIPYKISDEIIMETITDGNVQIIKALGISPPFTIENMTKTDVIEQWDNIYDSFPNINWYLYEQAYFKEFFGTSKIIKMKDETVLKKFKDIYIADMPIPFRILRLFHDLWPQLEKDFSGINWNKYKQRWINDPVK